MGGLARKIPITYVTMLIGSVAIAGRPAARGLLQQGRDPRRRLQGRLPLGLGDRLRGRRHDGLLHVPAHGPDLLGQEPHGSRGRAPRPRVAAVDDPAARAARHPVGLPGHSRSACPPETGLLHQWLAPVFEHTIEASPAGPRRPTTLFGIDGAPGPRHNVAGRHRDRRRLAPLRRRDPVARPARRAAARPVREISERPVIRPVLPRLVEQVVVRRPQPPAVRGLAAARLADGRLLVRSDRSSTARSTASAPSPPAPGSRLRRVQTGHVQNYALGIAIGLIAMAIGYLVIAAR